MTITWAQWLVLVLLVTASHLTTHAITGCWRASAAHVDCNPNTTADGLEVSKASARIESKLDTLLEVKREQLDVLREIAKLTREGALR